MGSHDLCSFHNVDCASDLELVLIIELWISTRTLELHDPVEQIILADQEVILVRLEYPDLLLIVLIYGLVLAVIFRLARVKADQILLLRGG